MEIFYSTPSMRNSKQHRFVNQTNIFQLEHPSCADERLTKVGYGILHYNFRSVTFSMTEFLLLLFYWRWYSTELDFNLQKSLLPSLLSHDRFLPSFWISHLTESDTDDASYCRPLGLEKEWPLFSEAEYCKRYVMFRSILPETNLRLQCILAGQPSFELFHSLHDQAA